jgi:hypothetical protein
MAKRMPDNARAMGEIKWDVYLEGMENIHNVMVAYYLDVKEHAVATRDPLDGTKTLNSVGGKPSSYGL